MSAKKPTIWLLDEYKLSMDSWWFQLGAPATMSFSEYFALEEKEERTDVEEERRKKMLHQIVESIDLYLEHKAFPPSTLPHAMYADFQVMYAKFPREKLSSLITPVFGISSKYIMITEPLFHILRNFCLGSTQISPVKLYEKTTGELLSEQTYYFINVCENHGYLSPEDNSSIKMAHRGLRKIYSLPSNNTKAKKFRFSQESLNCPVDIWHDPLLEDSVFLSEPLLRAIQEAGLYKGFSCFSCVLV
ncbi:MAG: hypothetical protein D8H97_35070 [Neisseria sp.]|jgi:hypothetical protein|nr:MAG: hypothetical protein D8H97_35070 [Neisseria sp.]